MPKITLGAAITAISIAVVSTPVSAACYCACVNNKKITVCENSWDTPSGTYCSGTYCTSALEVEDGSTLIASLALSERVELSLPSDLVEITVSK
ncbi:hypothetical protein PXK30_09495 [Phaeobacter gallaeciensis]|jgi:hypothetical protein|uniref:hypothetical protein n=1 Tax=Phaeobacter gallaeciensis TaxID=60890 RepID=UPI00237FCC33|nr:hypothetical protein [Phaeobacter gallaeciensis]MDE4303644.1 hypothetical protein [Phaeobacter gallaeciensis]MDE4335113.1 hypothetical protein [Phaeobacter gallaeciensis]MDE4352503.1 hypothetical protein [Phaeobacter gallaeciensis]MDE4361593.1 hypothetical protein [Phaeobacter gallaeciensis]MDE4370529.1 hypothetical protein [Phaeobacter gallaeciensis]